MHRPTTLSGEHRTVGRDSGIVPTSTPQHHCAAVMEHLLGDFGSPEALSMWDGEQGDLYASYL